MNNTLQENLNNIPYKRMIELISLPFHGAGIGRDCWFKGNNLLCFVPHCERPQTGGTFIAECK